MLDQLPAKNYSAPLAEMPSKLETSDWKLRASESDLRLANTAAGAARAVYFTGSAAEKLQAASNPKLAAVKSQLCAAGTNLSNAISMQCAAECKLRAADGS